MGRPRRDLLLGLRGAGAAGARHATAPAFVWLVPLAMYVSVVFLASETPRYRAPLDPFVIVLAALAIVALARLQSSPRGEVLDRD